MWDNVLVVSYMLRYLEVKNQNVSNLLSKGSGKKLCIHRHTYAHTHKGYANDKVG